MPTRFRPPASCLMSSSSTMAAADAGAESPTSIHRRSGVRGNKKMLARTGWPNLSSLIKHEGSFESQADDIRCGTRNTRDQLRKQFNYDTRRRQAPPTGDEILEQVNYERPTVCCRLANLTGGNKDRQLVREVSNYNHGHERRTSMMSRFKPSRLSLKSTSPTMSATIIVILMSVILTTFASQADQINHQTISNNVIKSTTTTTTTAGKSIDHLAPTECHFDFN